MLNTDCEVFRQNLTNLIGNSGLPAVVAYYILKDSLNELKDVCQEVLDYEAQIPDKEEEKSEPEPETKEEEEEAE